MSDCLCISCARKVTKPMHAISCDGCEGWQHRVCKTGDSTGITSAQYKKMRDHKLELEWFCKSCRSDAEPAVTTETEEPSSSTTMRLPDRSPFSSPVRELNTTYVVRADTGEPLETDDNMIPHDLTTTSEDISMITHDLTSSTDDLVTDTLDLTTTSEDISTVTPDFSTLTDDMDTATHDLTTTSDDISTVTPDLTTLTDDMDTATHDLTTTSDDISTVTPDLTTLTDDMDTATHDLTTTSEDISTVTPDLTTLTVPNVLEDLSFNIVNRDFTRPDIPTDESLLEPPPDEVVPEEVPETFEVIESGSERGGKKLISSHGYTYTVRTVRGNRTYWTCSIRRKDHKCTATVRQFAGLFTSSHIHSHPPDPSAGKKVKMTVKVKQVARQHVFKPAGEIVENVMCDMTTASDAQLPKPQNLSRTANRHRQKFRPQEPSNLQFQLDREFIGPDFVIEDVTMDGARHLIFGTQVQLGHLRKARRWFIDGTFKIVKKPFYQLSSIHAFVKSGEDVKQVPLVYMLMSRRSKEDYVQVLNSLRRHLGQPIVEWIMMDFEAAWDNYEDEEITTTQLLRACSSIAGLATVNCHDPIHDEDA